MNNFSKYFKPSFVPAIAWLVFSTVLLCLPGSTLPDKPWLHIIWFDKWVHIFLFGWMVIFWSYAFTSKFSDPKQLRIIFFTITISTIAYGIIMEFVQDKFIPLRTFDAKDMIADSIGSITGLIFMVLFIKSSRRNSKDR